MCQIIARTHKVQEIINFRQPTNPLKHELMKAAGNFAPKLRHSIRFPASETSRALLSRFASLALRASVARFALGFFFFLTEHDLWQVYFLTSFSGTCQVMDKVNIYSFIYLC